MGVRGGEGRAWTMDDGGSEKFAMTSQRCFCDDDADNPKRVRDTSGFEARNGGKQEESNSALAVSAAIIHRTIVAV